jgi:leucyl/phenylalanyl-tRNA--protein transferase
MTPLSVRALLCAYRAGIFPMGEPGGGVAWFDPDPRAIIPLQPGLFRVPRSLRQRVRSTRFDVRTDTAFERVVRACARAHARQGVWLTPAIIRAYTALHRAGHAHSVEAYLRGPEGETLAGGLYGVAVGGLFAGESMFSLPGAGGADASKVCLVHLVAHLRQRGFLLLDTQFSTPHLERFGCVEIPRAEYRRRLAHALASEPAWRPFDPASAHAMPELRPGAT